MNADLTALSALLDLLRAKGVQVYKHDGTEILLAPAPQPMRSVVADTLPPTVTRVVADARDAETNGRELTDEEILFASSQGWPDDEERGAKQ